MGYSLTIGAFKPYVAVGIGGYSAGTKKDIEENEVFGLHLEGMTGIDLCFNILSLGFVYKIKYLHGAGYVDNIGGSIGLIW